MRRYLMNATEAIDASVFSGDMLMNDAERAELKRLCERWLRAIAQHEANEEMQ